MKLIPHYDYFKTKRDKEPLINVVELSYVKPFIPTKFSHSLAYYDISFIYEGSGFFTINEQTHLVKPNDVIFTKPHEARNWDKIGKGCAFIFDETFMQALFNDQELMQNLSFFAVGRYSVKLSLSPEDMSKANQLLASIKDYIAAPGNNLYKLRAYIYELFILLNRAYMNENNVLPVMPEANKKVKNRYANEFLKMVGAEYNQQHSIRYYADKLDITPNYLNEMVKQSIGMNAKQYVQNRITLEAKRMLTHTNQSVSAISAALCFENVSYFVRFFRIQTSYTPLQYRNMVKSGLYPNNLGFY